MLAPPSSGLPASQVQPQVPPQVDTQFYTPHTRKAQTRTAYNPSAMFALPSTYLGPSSSPSQPQSQIQPQTHHTQFYSPHTHNVSSGVGGSSAKRRRPDPNVMLGLGADDSEDEDGVADVGVTVEVPDQGPKQKP